MAHIFCARHPMWLAFKGTSRAKFCHSYNVRNLHDNGIQGLFSQSIRGAETGHFGLISENFDPF